MQLPSGKQQNGPYALTVVPPFILAALFPQIFFKVSITYVNMQCDHQITHSLRGPPAGRIDAIFMLQALDFAGTYGVLTLFGLIPAASVWSQRYHNNDRLPAFRVRNWPTCSCCMSALPSGSAHPIERV